MAEAFGVVSGTAGLISLLIQVNQGFEILQNARKQFSKAPEELELLNKELGFLALSMDRMIKAAKPSDQVFLAHCETSCQQVVKGLEELDTRFKEAQKTKGAKRMLKVLDFKDWKTDLNILRTRVEGALTKLSLVSSFQSHTSLKELTLVHHVTRGQEALARYTPHTYYTTLNTHTPDQALELFNLKHGRKTRQSCFTRECTCSCHRKEKTGGRFWMLQYTPLAAMQQACDNEACTGSSYGFNLRLALSQLGLRWATVVQFHILAAAGTFSLRPSLQVESVVPYTSPGFDILMRIDTRMISFDRAKGEFLRLHYNDPTLSRHVNPAGVSYLEDFMKKLKNWHFRKMDNQLFDFIKFLSVDLSLLCHSNLSRLMKWSMEVDCQFHGSEFLLVKTLLDSGLDPLESDVPNEEFHRPKAMTYWSPYDDALRLICPLNPGFMGMTPLHEAILLGWSPSIVQHWVTRSDLDVKNYLGQTPLHLAAAYRPEVISILLHAGHKIDVVDNYNHTVIDYAVEAGDRKFAGDSIAAIVKAGMEMEPDKQLVPQLWLPLMSSAIDYRDTETTVKGVRKLKECNLSHHVEPMASVAMVFFMEHDEESSDGSTIHQAALDDLLGVTSSRTLDLGMIESGEDEMTVYASILNFVSFPSHVKTLHKHNFDIKGYTNDEGQNAFWMIQSPNEDWQMRCYADVFDALLTCGVDPNHQDKQKHTPLFHLLGASRAETEMANKLIAPKPLHEAVLVLLRGGADCSARDGCRCSCSPEGCLPSATLSANARPWTTNLTLGSRLPLWTVEYLSILEDQCDPSVAHQTLLAIMRRAKHEDLGMTHVCCQRTEDYESDAEPLDDEDADDILEEEQEFITQLDTEMEPLTKLSYEELMEAWFSQMRTSLDLDLSDDRAVNKLIEYFCYYALELEILRNDPSWLFLTGDQSERDQWYKKRRDRLFQLVRILGVPENKLSYQYNKMSTVLYGPSKYADEEHDRGVERFMSGHLDTNEQMTARLRHATSRVGGTMKADSSVFQN